LGLTSTDGAPLRILHVVDNMGKGGLENGLANLIERLDPQRFEHVVAVIRHTGLNSDRLPKHTRLIHLDMQPASRVHAMAFARLIRQMQPDIVHSRNWGTIEAVAASRLSRVVSTVHSEHGLDWSESAHEPRRRRWFRRLSYELADRVFCVSRQLRAVHASRTGFPADRISVIYNGVDLGRYHQDAAVRAQVRREFGLAERDLCIGCVGNLSPVKDYMTLLRAIARFAGACQHWRLLIFGDGPERDALESFVQGHPEWADRVSMPGIVDRVPDLLKAFDVFVLASLTEGISNSLLEAMATGLCVVATATGGNPEVVVDGHSGLLFPVGDDAALVEHLQLLEREPERRQRLGAEAMRRAATDFSLDTMVGRYAELYASLQKRSNAKAS
jgi:sugar transferase (PEP-CTERM/EpsH1 system associated)